MLSTVNVEVHKLFDDGTKKAKQTANAYKKKEVHVMKCNVCLDTATANSLINCQLSDVITYTALRFHICDLTLMTASAFMAMYNLISKIYGMSILMEELSYKSSNIKPGIQVGKLTVNDLKFILTR